MRTHCTADQAIRILHYSACTNTPERSMWFAVLGRAIADAFGNIQSYKQEARYFFTTSSFVRICSVVNLEPEYVLRCMAYVGKPIPPAAIAAYQATYSTRYPQGPELFSNEIEENA